jgi:hypothetical protein
MEKLIYCKNVLDVDCQTQGRLKLMIGLYVREKSVINKLQIPYKRAWLLFLVASAKFLIKFNCS